MLRIFLKSLLRCCVLQILSGPTVVEIGNSGPGSKTYENREGGR